MVSRKQFGMGMISKTLQKALRDLRVGKPVLVYHPKERETCMLTSAYRLSPSVIRVMKKYASSDISIAISYEVSEKLGLPFFVDAMRSAESDYPVLKQIIPKGVRNPFSLMLDHVDCTTGSSDRDKLMLIRELADILKKGQYDRFPKVVRAPGHLKLFIASRDLERWGHTELSVALMMLAGLPEIAVISSMRDEKTGEMMGRRKVIEYARKNDLALLDAKQIIEASKRRSLTSRHGFPP